MERLAFPPRIIRRGAFLSLLINLLVLVVGCAKPSSEPIIVGLNPWPGYEAFFLAEKLDLFRKRGLTVKLVEFESLGDARRAFERGQLDVVASTLVELLISRDYSDREATAIYVADYSNGSDILLADPKFKEVRDLKGARVGVEAATVDVFVLYMALRSAGLELTDVKIVPSSVSESVLAYKRRDLDAVQAYPPASYELEELGARRIFDSSEVPGKVVDIIFSSKEVIERRKNDLGSLLSAFAEAQELAIADRNGERRMMAEREKLSLENFNRGFLEIVHVPPSEQEKYLGPSGILIPTAAEVHLALRESGQLNQDIDLTSITNSDCAAAVQRNGV